MGKLTPDPSDGLWRIYHGSGRYHHYNRHQLAASWQHQVADCGRATRTGNGSYAVWPTGNYQVCGRCLRLNQDRATTRSSHGIS